MSIKADFSRWTGHNARAEAFDALYIEQGKPYTDADWNESVSIQLERSEATLVDLIGRYGAPKREGGFGISPPGESGSSFLIGPGAFYVDGARIVNQGETTYEAQSGEITQPNWQDSVNPNATALVYLEAARVLVSNYENGNIADPALGGISTSLRQRIDWRVRVRTLGEDGEMSTEDIDQWVRDSRCGNPPPIADWQPGDGSLSVAAVRPTELPDTTECELPPEAGYISQENQLYRVEVSRGGTRSTARFIWSRENASIRAVLGRNTDGEFILLGARDDDVMGFNNNGWVELIDDRSDFTNDSKRLLRMTLTGDVVSFPGVGIPDFDELINPRIIRWDHSGTSAIGEPMGPTEIDIERGIQVNFTVGSYRKGDYWVFEARAATGDVLWPPYPVENTDNAVTAMGWSRRFVPLAIGVRNGDVLTDLMDVRATMPVLNCLEANDVGFDDSVCDLGASTIQEALDVLCARVEPATGLCTYVATSGDELASIINNIDGRRSIRICLRAGVFELRRPLIVSGLANVIIEGTGPQSILTVREHAAAFVFRDCVSVRVTDCSVNGGRMGAALSALVNVGRMGTITTLNCGDVSIERVRVRTRAGILKGVGCLVLTATQRRSNVLVRDCVLKIGQAQIGMQITNATKSVVENNQLLPIAANQRLVRRRIMADKVLLRQIVRSMVRLPARSAENRATDEYEVLRVNVGQEQVRLQLHPLVTQSISGLQTDPILRTAETSRELRSRVLNIVNEAIRTNGRVRVGSTTRQILDLNSLAITTESFIAEGIVVAGDEVRDTLITGNTIGRCIDGIRVGASTSNDPNPPNWAENKPDNIVQTARVNDNTVELRSIANSTWATGIEFGHVNVCIANNNIVESNSIVAEHNGPQQGIFQFGFRGPMLSWTANLVTGMRWGFVVQGEHEPVGAVNWRLRDNAVDRVSVRNATVAAVEWI